MKTHDITRILVTVDGGNVQDVENVPKGVEVVIRDYDNAVDNDGEPTEAVYTFEG
jgi:hypothetical protein